MYDLQTNEDKRWWDVADKPKRTEEALALFKLCLFVTAFGCFLGGLLWH